MSILLPNLSLACRFCVELVASLQVLSLFGSGREEDKVGTAGTSCSFQVDKHIGPMMRVKA